MVQIVAVVAAKNISLLHSSQAVRMVLAKAADKGMAGTVAEAGRGQMLTGQQGSTTCLQQPLDELTSDESAALLYMREEEKLAHDVYVTLFAQWNLPTFQNISRSEQTHTDAVKTLIDRYGLQDPASSSVGVFTNPDLQALYNDLVARGSQSLAEALKVGAAIEEIDIRDLRKRLAADRQRRYSADLY